jgi:hypothetical protein
VGSLRKNQQHEAMRAWRGAMAAAVLTVIGVPLELVIGRNIPGMPVWPLLAATATGVACAVLLLLRRHKPTVTLGSITFLVSAIAIVMALWKTSDFFATTPAWSPFQANKLGALTVALLAPELWVGTLSILGYVGSAVAKLYLFSPDIRAGLPIAEPWATVAFGIFGIALLFYRRRQLAVERKMVGAQAEAAALAEVARSLLAVSDMANTPLQNIELNLALIKRHGIPELRNYVDRIERAVARLRESSKLLASYERRLEWQIEDASFNPRARLEKGD